MDSETMLENQKNRKDISTYAWYKQLCSIVGDENVISDFSELLAYGRDRSSFANLKYRFGKLPLSLPSLVVSPATYDEVSKILRVANEYKLPVVPYGAGSGVMGGLRDEGRQADLVAKG